MQLTSDETKYLGAHTDVLEKNTNMKRKDCHSEPYIFNCTTATYKFENCSKRHVPLSGETIIEPFLKQEIVQKYADGNGFFPTIAAHTVKIDCSFISERNIKELDILKSQVQYIDINIDKTKNEIIISNLDQENCIFEFDFGCHNFGFSIYVLSREK